MNREWNKLNRMLEGTGWTAQTLLSMLSERMVACESGQELTLAGGVVCRVSRCGLDADGRRYFPAPYELCDDEALDLHWITVRGKCAAFCDLWQAPWPAARKRRVHCAA